MANRIQTEQVLTSILSDYVVDSLNFKQIAQEKLNLNSKYQSRTPFVRLSSNAVKWLDVDAKVKLFDVFEKIQSQFKREIIDSFINGPEVNTISINFENYGSNLLSNSFLVLNKNSIINNNNKFQKRQDNGKILDGKINFKNSILSVSSDDIKNGNILINSTRLSDFFYYNHVEGFEFYLDPDIGNIDIPTGDIIDKELYDAYNKNFYPDQSGNLGFLVDYKNKLYAKAKDGKKIINKKYSISVKEKDVEYTFLKMYVIKNDESEQHKIQYKLNSLSFFSDNETYNVDVSIDKNVNIGEDNKFIVVAIRSDSLNAIIESATANFFKIQKLNFDKLKLLTILYDVIFNGLNMGYDSFLNKYRIDVSSLGLDNNYINKIRDSFKYDDSFARKHVLNGIDMSGKSFDAKYDGGFFIFEKDGNIKDDEYRKKLLELSASVTDAEFGGIESKIEEAKKKRDEFEMGTKTNYIRQGLGYRPKAGITGMSVETQGNIGVLRKITINLKAFTLEQLEMIQSLYMRPGTFLFLEWGWSIYPDLDLFLWDLENFNQMKIKPNTSFINFFENSFLAGTPNNQSNKGSASNIVSMIDKLKRDTFGHYDATFGVVSNFSWNMNDSGEFDISINLVSNTTSLLALQMSSSKGFRETAYSVDIFSVFRNYFNVLSPDNSSFRKLGEISRLQKHGFDLKSDIPFYKIGVVEEDKSKKFTGNVSISGGSTNYSDFIREVCKDGNYVDIVIPLNFDINKKDEFINGKQKVKVKNTNSKYFLDDLPGKYIPGEYISSDEEDEEFRKSEAGKAIISAFEYINRTIKIKAPSKTHTIRFPLANKLIVSSKFNGVNTSGKFDPSLITRYLKNQGFSSGGNNLNYLSEELSKISDFLLDPMNICLGYGVKVTPDVGSSTTIGTPIIKQIFDNWKSDKNIFLVDEKNNRFQGKLNITVKSIKKAMMDGIKKHYIDAYQSFVHNLYNFQGSHEFTKEDHKKFKNSFKNNGNDEDVFYEIFSNPYGVPSGSDNILPVGHFGINLNAYYDLLKLEHYGNNISVEKKWDADNYNPAQAPKIYSTIDGTTRHLRFKDVYKSGEFTTELTEKSSSSVFTLSVTETDETKVRKNGGFDTFFIRLDYLFKLLNESLLSKKDIDSLLSPFKYEDYESNEREYFSKISELESDIKDLKDKRKRNDIKNDSELKEHILIHVKNKVDEYNMNVKNLKNSLFSEIDITSQIPFRKVENLTSIRQGNVVFLTKKISELLTDKNNTYNSEYIKAMELAVDGFSVDDLRNSLINSSVDNVGSDANSANIIKSCYISCKFINECIKQSLSLDTFIRSIFSEIFEASGLFIDLSIMESKKGNSYVFKICDRKYDISKNINEALEKNQIYKFSALSRNTIMTQLSFGAKLPTSFQRVAFVASSLPRVGSSSNSGIVNNVLNNFSSNYVNNPNKLIFINDNVNDIDFGIESDLARKKNKKTLDTLIGNNETNNEKTVVGNPLDYSAVLDNPDFGSYYSNFIENNYILKSNNGESQIDSLVKKLKNNRWEIPPIGLELSFKISGTSGLEWGNLISIDYLPNAISNSVFQIVKISDEIGDGVWTTGISCVLRSIGSNVGNASNNISGTPVNDTP